MRVGNGSKVDVITVGTLPLHLPALSMNIISGSCLMRDGYSFKSENNGCSIYMSNIFYGHCRCQDRRISGRGSRTVGLGSMVTGGRGHDVYPGSGPLDGGNTLCPA